MELLKIKRNDYLIIPKGKIFLQGFNDVKMVLDSRRKSGDFNVLNLPGSYRS